MYRHELYKVFTRKSIYVLLICIILTMAYANSSISETMKEDVYQDLERAWGGAITQEKLDFAAAQMRASDATPSEGAPATEEERAADYVYFRLAVAGQQAASLQQRQDVLWEELDKLNAQSYAYREAEKELSMLKRLDQPHGFYLIRSWRGMFDFIEPAITPIVLSSLILLGLTPIFADEYSQRTIGLVFSTKRGKKRVVTVKIMAALTYVLVIFVLLHVANLALQWHTFGGFQGWQAPIQNLLGGMIDNPFFAQSPFAWDVWQFYAITLSVQFFACVAVAVLVLCFSMVIKNSMITFFISGAVIAVPSLVGQVGQEQGILNYLSAFNFVELLRVDQLFQEFSAYNIFGHPILYPHIIVLMFMILTGVIVGFSYYYFKHQQLNM